MIDSYYEYLLKAWLLFGDEDCKSIWESSIKAIHTYLADETENGLWYGQANMESGKRTSTRFGALTAFFPIDSFYFSASYYPLLIASKKSSFVFVFDSFSSSNSIASTSPN